MPFDWLTFLSSRGIPYVTDGPNVPRGDIAAVRCPWCGSSDPSQHLTIGHRGWHCWRNRDHKGKSPVRLVQALIQCSLDEARHITGQDAVHIPDDFLSMVQRNLSAPLARPKHKLTLPKQFRPFKNLPSARPFISYFKSRHFSTANILHDFTLYDIRYCMNGPFKGRVIFPVTFEHQLVSWSGRSISPRAVVRYKSLTTDPELAREMDLLPAIDSITEYLLWFDQLMETDCDTIVLCEGPFDSLKVNMLGMKHGICSTCFFTASPSKSQLILLNQLLPRFRRRVLLLDRNTLPTALKVAGWLRDFDVEIGRLPDNVKDPGDASLNILLDTLAI